MTHTVEIVLSLPEDIVVRLEAEGERQNTPLNTLITEAVRDYLMTFAPPDEETPDDQIIAGIREGMRQALRGQVRPAMETLEEIEREFADE